MGQNPTSGLLSLVRRREIYALCQEYDVLIIEDDPYWYLQYPSANDMSLKSRGKPVSPNHPANFPLPNYNADKPTATSGYPFLDSLVPSYLHLDSDGRVIRLDTFSKTVAPGCRLGWITAQPLFIDKILRITETSTQQPSGFVQSMIAELIMGPQTPSDGGRGGGKDGAGWNMDGWVRWLEGLRGNYERRMQKMSTILEEGKFAIRFTAPSEVDQEKTHSSEAVTEDFQLVSKTQMYDFAYPMAGMFLWMRIHLSTHPLFDQIPHPRLAKALWVHLTTENYRVLVAPGTIFSPTEELKQKQGWRFFRLCFAAVGDDVVEKHSVAVVHGFNSFWSIKTVREIDDLLRDEDVSTRNAMNEHDAACQFWV